MIRLKRILMRLGRQQAELADALHMSRAGVAQWLNHSQWPRGVDSQALRLEVTAWLKAAGARAEELEGWWRELPGETARQLIGPGRGRGKRAAVRERTETVQDEQEPDEDSIMLLRGQKLSEVARKHFGLFRDPFRDEIREPADLFVTPDLRYCREAMWQTARHGGMTAIVGESGSGKSTLREDLHERIKRSGEAIRVIEPYVIDMEERVGRRRTLGARDIAAAIVAALDPHASLRQDSQARFRQTHGLLAESARVGNRHLLIIEEAHDIPTPTLRHLKRYLELKDGFTPLLGVLLLGQPELGLRLSELDASIREIVQRCELVELRPLDARLGEFLEHKLGRHGKAVAEVLSADAIEAVQARLTVQAARGRALNGTVSLVYPLAVQNLVAAAINRAADLGLDRVTADVIREV